MSSDLRVANKLSATALSQQWRGRLKEADLVTGEQFAECSRSVLAAPVGMEDKARGGAAPPEGNLHTLLDKARNIFAFSLATAAHQIQQFVGLVTGVRAWL